MACSKREKLNVVSYVVAEHVAILLMLSRKLQG
jgi:hypothetical protein